MAKIGAAPVTSPGWTGKPKKGLKIVDCDVHHNISNKDQLMPYLSKIYQEHLLDQGLLAPSAGYFNTPFRSTRTDLVDQSGSINPRDFCTDYTFLIDEHLDRWNIDYALLTGPPALLGGLSGLPDPDYAAAICRALNEWTIENWINKDERLLMGLFVAPSDPVQAAQEVRRLGNRKNIVAIVIPTGARMPYGNRYFHPLWEACEEYNLAVVVHPGGAGAGINPPITAVGYPTYYMEERMARPSQASAHAASLICEGVFEKFSSLKFAFIEVQQHWAIGLMWHMDSDWKSIRDQTPWVKRKPSEYFRDHIRVGSQPLHEPENTEQLIQMLNDMHAEDTLIYCSDFPHYDWNDPVTTFPQMSEKLHRNIFSDNACDLFQIN